jgi:GH15 family glucan-1,4-alpha-glucosidase
MRSLILGNGSFLVALDTRGQVRDLYFPRVGLEDHVFGELVHRIGVYTDGMVSWFSDPAWDITVTCDTNALKGATHAKNETLGVEVTLEDVVYNESAIFLRKVRVKNLRSSRREIKVYFGQEFSIYHSPVGDTGYYDPAATAVIHYKGQRVFLISGQQDGHQEFDYAVGLANFEGKEGTFRDAEDGELSKNPIEHGPADSVLGFYAAYDGGEERTLYVWLTAGKSLAEAKALQTDLLAKTPEHLIETTTNFWNAWVNKYDWSFYRLSVEEVALFKKSLMFVRAHVDDGGGIIASPDSDTLHHGKDTYAYVWPRDAAYAALALLRAGDPNVAERFFAFCEDTIEQGGYFMHKYLPDKSLGSSWHPWIKDGKTQLPIQEDETALVLCALWQHYEHSRDLEFIEKLYNPLVRRAADFLLTYRDRTGLPGPSYDLWEEKRGTSVFTASAVYGALIAAEKLSTLLGKKKAAKAYADGAKSVQAGILDQLFDPDLRYFVKQIDTETGVRDLTIDISSAYGVFAFGVLPVSDKRLTDAFRASVDALSVNGPAGGIARYERDTYWREGAKSNAWFIATLWYAEYLIARAESEEELEEVRALFAWTAKHALPSGVLSEQLSAETGAQVSVAPLCWSHAAYVNAVMAYLDKLEKLGICAACNPAP